jgi:Na+-translocating ferredoxin:NAD+ oxidoreductase RnfG subunit
MKDKKGVSTVVTIMILILFTLLIAGIIWNLVSKTAEKDLSEAKSCYDLLNKVVINSKYTCYDLLNEKMHVSVEVRDIEIEKLFIAISYEHSSDIFELTNKIGVIENFTNYNGTIETRAPSKNSGKTYTATNVTETPLSVELTPVLNENLCKGDVFTGIEFCSQS